MTERKLDLEAWVAPATFLTIAMMAVGMILPPFIGMESPEVAGAARYWLQTVLVCMASVGFVAILVMAVRRVPQPLAAIRASIDRQRLLSLGLGWFLIAANLTAFGLIKPELGRLGFAADPLLAAADRILFFGADGWRVFERMRHPFIGEAYHIVWLGWLFLALTIILWERPSVRKSRLLIVYFLLWSIIGPLVHIALPAAGPVLDAALTGHGFDGLEVVASDAQKFNYLLDGYRTATFNPGGGISAMPSLHIATMAWTVFYWRGPLRWLAIAITAYMWAASVVLGWHYFVDGLVGIGLVWAAMARLSYRGGRREEAKSARSGAPASPPVAPVRLK